MRISCVQMDVLLGKPEENLARVKALTARAAEGGADVIVLPETWNVGFFPREGLREMADPEGAGVRRELGALAKELGVSLVAGSAATLREGKVFNTAYVFDRSGECVGRYDKTHLFSPMGEHEAFTPGSGLCTFRLDGVKCALILCYDVRFPELFRVMAREGAELICLPAQFNMTTGPAHWEPSLRMRAVDNEIFFVGAAAARYEGFSYECWGHSMIIDPFGTKLAEADEKEQIIYAEIDLDRIREVRAQLPTFLHLREDVYSIPAPVKKP